MSSPPLRVRLAAIAFLATTFVLSGTQIGLAQDPGSTTGTEPFVVLTGRLDVPEGTTVDDAVIFNGHATIDGKVKGSVVAFNGDVTVSGTVGVDVVAVNGRVTLLSGAVVEGNVVSQIQPEIAPDATLGGQVLRNEFRGDGLILFGRIAFWLAASVASLLFGLLLTLFVPRAADSSARAAKESVGASIGIGLALFIGIPIVGVIALVTLVGALFGVALLAGVFLLYLTAYSAGALALGRLMLKPPRNAALAFLLGWASLRVLALVPVLGGFMFAAAAVWGFGALVIAARRSGRGKAGEMAAPSATDPALMHHEDGAAGTVPPMPPAP
jgi:cytoskeletal protein CcmA (bactofilin family)